MNAHVIIGDEAGPAAHFVNKNARVSFDSDARADGIAIGFCGWHSGSGRSYLRLLLGCRESSDRPERDPVICVVDLVDQKAGWRVHIADHGGEVPVVPQISNGETS